MQDEAKEKTSKNARSKLIKRSHTQKAREVKPPTVHLEIEKSAFDDEPKPMQPKR